MRCFRLASSRIKFFVIRFLLMIREWFTRSRKEQTQAEVSGYDGFNAREGRSFRANNNLRPPKQC